MKTKIFSGLALIIALLLKAQSADLLNTNWQITKIVYGGQTYFPPAMPYSQSTNFFPNSTSPNITAGFFNTMMGDFVFDTANPTFTKSSAACTLAVYDGDQGQVNQFSQLNCNFFTMPTSGNFTYVVTANATQKNMIITNPAGNEIHYFSAILSVIDFEKSKDIVLFPNPASESVTLKNLQEHSQIVIYDTVGKVVLRKLSNIEKKIDINISSLAPGNYVIAVNNTENFKFIKK